MSYQTNGGSSRQRKYTVGGALAAAASIATILGFLHPGGSSPAPAPAPASSSQPAPAGSGAPVPSGSSSAYPASAEASFMSTCEQSTGAPASHCACDLTWVEAYVPYWQYAQEPGAASAWLQEAEGYANCP